MLVIRVSTESAHIALIFPKRIQRSLPLRGHNSPDERFIKRETPAARKCRYGLLPGWGSLRRHPRRRVGTNTGASSIPGRNG